jgi:broad specificity phosphatase PhoE
MRYRFIHLLLLLFLTGLMAETPQAQNHSSDITTFILVRHAEKVDDSRDPHLSTEGQNRAERLLSMLNEADIDAIYSTDLNRTKETVQPIAENSELDILIYDHQTPEETVNKWLADHSGETIIVSGHSNTTPTFTNSLLGREYFTGSFDESDYGNLLIVTISGSGESNLLHLRY